MESLKLPKGSASGGNTSITVRFNAGEESIDDLFPAFQNSNNNGGAGTNSGSGVSSSGVSGGGGGGGNTSVGNNEAECNSSTGSSGVVVITDDDGGGSTHSGNESLGTGGALFNSGLSCGTGGGGDSLSSSPRQPRQSPSLHSDDSGSRNNFLQSNFFARKSGLSANKQQLSPNHPCSSPLEGSLHSPSSIAGGCSPFNGSQAGGSGGISPISSSGISPNKYRRSISFPGKGGNSPTPGYSLDPTLAHAAVAALCAGNGSNAVGATGGGDAPYLGGVYGSERMVGNGLDMRPLDHCLNDIICGLGAVGHSGVGSVPDNGTSAANALAERLRNHKQLGERHHNERHHNERHMGERHRSDTLAIAGGGTTSGYLDVNMKMNSPSRSSPHSQGSEHMARYSRKVFVGGLPPDIDEDEITASFRRFGPLVVDWPHKAESKSYFPPKGYAFLLFQDENSVQQLIDSCITDDEKLYLCVSSPTIKDKPVQIRPWRLADADYVLDATMSLDPRKTVFVGGVPRPLKAFELAMIMDRLYGGVCYAGIDTDPELKYPKGAGRVAFSNQQSYIAAISARFVQLQHGDIDKRVEVKPYVLDDQMCDECEGQRCGGKFAPFFCANVTCLQYYCEHCWSVIHSRQGREYHKPLVKEGADRPRAVPFRWC